MITLVSIVPASGAVLASNAPVVFDIKTPTGSPFRRIVVAFVFGGLGFTELAYAQDPASVSAQLFEGPYNGSSSVTTITDAGFQHFQFRVFRAPLWPDSPKLALYAFDTAGVEL